VPRLPEEIWQQIARAALAAEGGDPRVLARLSAVCSSWHAAVRCAVVQADSLPGPELVPGEHLRYCCGHLLDTSSHCAAEPR